MQNFHLGIKFVNTANVFILSPNKPPYYQLIVLLNINLLSTKRDSLIIFCLFRIGLFFFLVPTHPSLNHPPPSTINTISHCFSDALISLCLFIHPTPVLFSIFRSYQSLPLLFFNLSLNNLQTFYGIIITHLQYIYPFIISILILTT